jgi:hypothetical protein
VGEEGGGGSDVSDYLRGRVYSVHKVVRYLSKISEYISTYLTYGNSSKVVNGGYNDRANSQSRSKGHTRLRTSDQYCVSLDNCGYLQQRLKVLTVSAD